MKQKTTLTGGAYPSYDQNYFTNKNYFVNQKYLDNYQFLDKIPEAFITYNKNRLKKYSNENLVYLNNGSEFELEIYNPSTSVLGIKIKMNDSFISDNFLVIKPGQRIHLDRFINNENKFKFNTYNVENTDEVKDIIKNNGNIELYFFKSKINNNNNIIYYNDFYSNDVIYGNFHYTQPGQFYCSTNINNSIQSTTSTNATTNDSIDLNSIETGMIEKGNKSEQKFDTIYADFNSISAHIINMKILPLSQKPIESKDLIKKCASCKTKLKKDWKFCAKCGTSIKSEQNFHEITFHYTDLSVNIFKFDMICKDYLTTYDIDLGYENIIKILSNKDKIYMIVLDDVKYMPGFFTIKEKKKEGKVILSITLQKEYI